MNMLVPVIGISKEAEEYLQDLADTLEIPEGRYEQATTSYHSLGEWLHRPDSTIRRYDPEVYSQGSFRLGTVIRPLNETEDYDVDSVCEFRSLRTSEITQVDLKTKLGVEMKSYARAHGMNKPVREGRRCWVLDYADGAQFHMDVVPSLPNGGRQRLLLEAAGHRSAWTDTAIVITDREMLNYARLTNDWPRSNPKGYAEWFKSRVTVIMERRRRELAERVKASVETIPDFKVRTPLQQAVMILKRHRDEMFADRGDERPISVIVTTLSAHAYQGESKIAEALVSILTNMERFVETRHGVQWIANPTDPMENFADKWVAHPERKGAFFEWLRQAQADFVQAARQVDRQQITETMARGMGRALAERANARRRGGLNVVTSFGRMFTNAAHRQRPSWPLATQGTVRIARAAILRSGFRPIEIPNHGGPFPKGCSIEFEATTDVPHPYKVFWQVVNTGAEAAAARNLRGDFTERGSLTHSETTRYAGQHWIECFIVKNGRLAARSGEFAISIQ